MTAACEDSIDVDVSEFQIDTDAYTKAREISIRSLPLSTRAKNAMLDEAIGWAMHHDRNNDGTVGQVYDKMQNRKKWKSGGILLTKNVGLQTAAEIRAVLLDADVPIWMVDDIAPALSAQKKT